MALMFESALRYFTLDQPGKYLSRDYHYVDFLRFQRDYAVSKAPPHMVSNSSAISLLARILSEADLEALLLLETDFDQYDEVSSISGDLDRMFSPVTLGSRVKTDFIRNEMGGVCKEWMFAVAPNDPYTTYPFGKDWSVWKSARPLRLHDIDSTELSFHYFYGQLSFRRIPAHRAVFTLDASLLVMQYLSYLRSNEEKIDVSDYLYRYVILPTLAIDSLDIWLLKLYTNILQRSDDLSVPLDAYWESANAGRIGGQYRQTVEEITDLAKLLDTTQILPCRFLASLRMSDISVNQKYHLVSQTCAMPGLIQYMWANMAVSKLWMNLLFTIVSRSQSLTEYATMRSYLRPQLKLLQASRPWTNVHDESMASSVKETLDSWKTVFDV